MIPLVRRTWAPRDQTPVLTHRGRHYEKVSGIGALTISPHHRRIGCYLHLYPAGDICQEAVVWFLRDLLRHLHSPIIVIWDRWNVHRGRIVRQFLEHRRRLQVEYFPPYAPELNPQEQCWRTMKYQRLANHGITELVSLESAVADEYRRIHTDQPILRSFIRASKLPIRL